MHDRPTTPPPAPAAQPAPRQPVSWARVKEIAGEAMERAAAEREAFLDLACEGEPELRRRVEAILAADEEAEDQGFLRPLSVEVPQPPTGAPGGRPVADDAEVLIGKRIGAYRVKRLIGVGGMGAVYEAVQEQPRRPVALKVMRSGLTSRSAMRRFQYEAQLLARLRHPGIAQVYEAGVHEAGALGGVVPYFAMEYIPAAKPVTGYAESRGLGVRQRLALFAKVCDAVHHGHQKGIVHRDLKPSNILVDSGGQAKIIDFGVARATDSDLALTTLQTGVGQLIGTLQYMSPEQCAADPADIDTRSDVYSLGVVLYELLTGRPPYDLGRAPPHEAARLVIEQTPARPSTLNRTLRGDVETIVLKALEKDRERRYQSALDLAHDIERYLRGEPIAARPPSLAYQASIFARRHKVIVGASLVSSLAMLVALLAIGAGLLGALRERDRARAAEAAARGIAARAQRMTDFLKSTLIAGDPHLLDAAAADGDDPLNGPATPADAPAEFTVADSLRRAVAMLDTAFGDDPTTAAELAAAIGSTFSRLGLYAEAEPLLRRALEARRKGLGPQNPDTIESMRLLAATLQHAGDAAGASALYREAADATRGLRGPMHEATLWARRDLARALAAQGLTQEALDLQRQTLETATGIHGQTDPTTLTHVAAMAGITLAAGDHAEAERLARRALMGLRIAGRSDSPHAAEAAVVLARALRVAGRPDEAESPLREALRIHSVRFGASSARTLPVRADLVVVLARLGRDSEAIAGAREAAAIAERAFEPESPRAAAAARLLAWTLARCGGDLDEAEGLARTSLASVRRGSASESARCAATLADILRRRGRLGEARAAIDELGAIAASLPDPERAAHLAAADHLRALVAWDSGDAAEAERLLARAMEATARGDAGAMLEVREELAEDAASPAPMP